MNSQAILDLLTARETTASAAADELRAQIAKLTDELATVEAELADLRTTRQTLTTLLHHELTTADPTITSETYQQILAVFTPGSPGMRAKDVCQALGLGTAPSDTEGLRGKLKRLVSRNILAENQRGVFTLAQKRT